MGCWKCPGFVLEVWHGHQPSHSAGWAYLAGLPPRHTFFVTALLVDEQSRREQVFIAVDGIRQGIISGKIWNRVDVVHGYQLGDYYSFPESDLRDWLIAKPDGTEEGNFVGKFLDGYEPPRTCITNTVGD